jgi:hypothetical protein
MSLLGQLRVEATAWRAAWRGRRLNPLAGQAALEFQRWAARRPAWRPCSRWMLFWGVLVSAATTYLLVVAYLRFQGVVGSSVVSRSFAATALLAGVVQVLDGAVLLASMWLLERLALAFWYSSALLAAHPGAREGPGGAFAASRLSDYEYVIGALQWVTRPCWTPLLLLAGLSALDEFLYGTGWIQTPPGAHLALPRIALAALMLALLKPVCGLLAIWATALVLLSFSPWWRHAAVSYFAAWLALAWQLPGVACVLPGMLGQMALFRIGDVVPRIFAEPWVAPVLLLLLMLLAAEAHSTSPLRAHQRFARWGMPALRPILACGLPVIAFFSIGNYIAFQLSDADQRWHWLGLEPSTLSLVLWPVVASSAASPIPLLYYVSTEMLQGLWVALRLMAQAGMPLLLVLIFAGHARAAVFLRRSVLG